MMNFKLLFTSLLLLSSSAASLSADKICLEPRPPRIDQTRGGPFPTTEELKAAKAWLDHQPPSTVFTPFLPLNDQESGEAMRSRSRFGPHIYLKDDEDELYHAEAAAFARGAQGELRRAWKLKKSIIYGGLPEDTIIMKDIDINLSQKNSDGSFRNEIDALEDLGRLVGGDATIVGASEDGGRTRRKFVEEERIREPQRGQLRSWYPEGTRAYFFQTFVRGTQLTAIKTRISRTKIYDLMRSIEMRMMEINGRGWTHGDLRPQNILAEPICDHEDRLRGFEVNIVDFGKTIPLINEMYGTAHDQRMLQRLVGYVTEALMEQ